MTRGWADVKTAADWKRRLRDYFKIDVPPHEWFEPWRNGLQTLGMSYEQGTAAHIDVSYRPTMAMLRDKTTDRKEFGQMVERDVAGFFGCCRYARICGCFWSLAQLSVQMAQPETWRSF